MIARNSVGVRAGALAVVVGAEVGVAGVAGIAGVGPSVVGPDSDGKDVTV